MNDITRDIIIEASGGDMRSFEKIYRSSSDFIYNVAYRVTNNKEDAQEITHDVFLKIFKNLKRFRFRSSFKTWAYRIAVNTAINAYRRKSKELSQRVDYNDAVASRRVERPINGTIEKEHNEMLIKSLLSALNPEQRTCVILRDMEGLSYKEIADVLGININTVRSRLKRARETLLAVRPTKGVHNGL